MSFRSYFSHSVFSRQIPKQGQKGEPVAAATAGTDLNTGNIGSLVSPDSLFTFSGASFAIWIIWSGVEKALGLPHNLLLGAIISLAAGGFLLWCDLTDPKRTPTPRTPIRVAVALVNTFILFNAASGAFTLAGSPASGANAPAQAAAAPASSP